MTEAILTGDGLKYTNALLERSIGFGLEAMNKGMMRVRKEMVTDSKRAGTHRYSSVIRNGHRVITDGASRRWGRVSKKTAKRESVDMGDLIRARLYLLSHTAIVGFMDTSRYNYWRFDDGIAKRGGTVKGTKSKAIAERIHNGGRQNLTLDQRRLFAASGFKGIASKGYVVHKPAPFMKFVKYRSLAEEVAKKEFDKVVKHFKVA